MAERSTLAVQLNIGRITEDDDGNITVQENQRTAPVYDFDDPAAVVQEILGLLMANLSSLGLGEGAPTLKPVRELLQKVEHPAADKESLHETVYLCPSCGEQVNSDEEYCYSCSYYYEGR